MALDGEWNSSIQWCRETLAFGLFPSIISFPRLLLFSPFQPVYFWHIFPFQSSVCTMSVLLIKSGSHSFVRFSRPSDLATLYSFFPCEFCSRGSLTGPTPSFCAPVLSADRMSCLTSSFLETISDGSSLR